MPHTALFEDTAIAFGMKSDRELQRARLLFQVMSYPGLVRAGKVLTNLALQLRLPINWAVKPTIYKHFVGGETIEACEPYVRRLEQYGVKAILDYSVEGSEDGRHARMVLEEVLRSIQHAATDENVPFAVFKPTAFAPPAVLEKISQGKTLSEKEVHIKQQFEDYVDTLCEAAAAVHLPILIDAEDSWYQDYLDEVVTSMMLKYNLEQAIVFNTLQMYRHDRLAYLKRAHQAAVEGGYYYGVKFVRGAYMEKERKRAAERGYPDPIQPDKAATDRDYDDALRYTMDHIENISIFNGTHNEASSALLAELIDQKGLARDDKRIWFAQLYGMSDHISFNLAHEGYNVAKYMPYGPVKSVMPYLIRRAEENTSIAGQTSRELSLIRKEVLRRHA